MEIGLIAGVARHARDADVIKAINSARRKLVGSGDTVIAIKNESAQVYRRCVINGLLQEMYLAERLEALGLIDETARGARKPKGIWAVCRRGFPETLRAQPSPTPVRRDFGQGVYEGSHIHANPEIYFNAP